MRQKLEKKAKERSGLVRHRYFLRKSPLMAVSGFLVGVVLLLYMRFSTLPPGSESSQDVYYHIAMADLGPIVYTQKDFPSLTMSCWRTTFSDKELAFHFILTGIRRIKGLLHLSQQPPFNIEYAFFAMILIFSFALVLFHYKVRHIYLYILPFVALAPFLTTRLELLRPHLLAMSLVLLSCLFFDYVRSLCRLWIPLVFGFVMAWSYSNPHFILLSAAVFSIVALRKDWRLAAAIPITILLGIVLGFTLHPQFPNTFINWKIQCVDVVLISIFKNSPVKLGYELCPGNFNFFVEHWMVAVLIMLNLFFALCFIRHQRLVNNHSFKQAWGALSDFEILALSFTLASFIAAVGIVMAVRAVEYAVPFLLISTGFNVRLVRASVFCRMSLRGRAWIFRCVAVAILLMSADGVLNYSRRASHQSVVPPWEFAAWLSKSQIPEYSVIGNVNWSDFPSLFYVAPNYFYLAGIDPMFAYFAHPEKMSALERFRTGRKALGVEELFEITGARYIFVSKRNVRLAADMYSLGFVAVYQGADGDLFDLAMTQFYMNKRD